jgi:hypothetical protein
MTNILSLKSAFMKCYFNSKNDCTYISIHNLNEKINNINQYPLLSLMKNEHLSLNYFIHQKKIFFEKIFYRNIIYNHNNILHINIILPNHFSISFKKDDIKNIDYVLYLKYKKLYSNLLDDYVYNINDFVTIHAKVVEEVVIKKPLYLEKYCLRTFDFSMEDFPDIY